MIRSQSLSYLFACVRSDFNQVLAVMRVLEQPKRNPTLIRRQCQYAGNVQHNAGTVAGHTIILQQIVLSPLDQKRLD
jgi:hypothetical protein